MPVALAHRAMELVIEEVSKRKLREGTPPSIPLPVIEAETANGGSMLDAINREVKRHKGRIDKIAFAKALIEIGTDAKLRVHVDQFLDRMRVVFRAVNEAVRRSSDDAANKKLETLVAERVALFKVDHPNYATREQAMIALRQIEAQLDRQFSRSGSDPQRHGPDPA